MAKILNRSSPEIMARQYSFGVPYVSVSDRGIIFSKALVYEAGIKQGRYVHFINEDDYWAFFINDHPDGFLISNNNSTLRCTTRVISDMFIKSTGRRIGEKFFTIKSTASQAGSPVYEIYTRESTIQVIDRQKRVKEQRKEVLLSMWKKPIDIK
jgi:hypothetical protein